MSDDAESRLARARARASWDGEIRPLANQPEVETVVASAAELVGLVYELTLAGWALSGREIPDYARAAMPGRVVRPAKVDDAA